MNIQKTNTNEKSPFSLLVFLAYPVWSQNPEENKIIKIETGSSCLMLAVGPDNYLYQLDYGKPGKEIFHQENGTVTLYKYASISPVF